MLLVSPVPTTARQVSVYLPCRVKEDGSLLQIWAFGLPRVSLCETALCVGWEESPPEMLALTVWVDSGQGADYCPEFGDCGVEHMNSAGKWPNSEKAITTPFTIVGIITVPETKKNPCCLMNCHGFGSVTVVGDWIMWLPIVVLRSTSATARVTL